MRLFYTLCLCIVLSELENVAKDPLTHNFAINLQYWVLSYK